MTNSNEALAAAYGALTTEAHLRDFVTTGTKEDLHLEFKMKRDPSVPDPGERKGWAFEFSRALSGFANSDGGILIWGIDTDRLERAKALRPISQVHEFLAALKKSILNSTVPVVDNIAMEVVLAASSTDGSAGYVKCLMPASERTPHRAMLAGREYYKRTIEGFYKMEHFDLEDMMGRRPVPRLRIAHEVRSGGSGSGHLGEQHADIAVNLTLVNEGRGSARAPYIEVVVPVQYVVHSGGVSDTHEGSLLRVMESAGGLRYVGLSDFLIHPDTSFHFATITRHFSSRRRSDGDLEIRGRMAAENTRVQNISFDISLDELLAVAGWNRLGPIPSNSAGS